jgi:hypothetical protein
MQRQLERSS